MNAIIWPDKVYSREEMADKKIKDKALAVLKQSSVAMSLQDISYALHEVVPERTLRRWLASWVKAERVIRLGNGRSTRYSYKTVDTKSFKFLSGLDKDLKISLLRQLRDLWTYTSTAIEGNTLTLGDTHFLLEEGLTVSGKPLKDHQEVIGHARAIDLFYQSLGYPLNEAIIFDLHKAVQVEEVADIYKPNGAWKVEPNGVYTVNSSGNRVYIEYALPQTVPILMDEFISEVNALDNTAITLENAHKIYAKVHMGFVHIHPFWDGNGRLARLIANIPLLKAGLPPLIIPFEKRRKYIEVLADYQITIGQLDKQSGVWPNASKLTSFEMFCQSAYENTKQLINEVQSLQEKRESE